ncbi:MAG TPA: glycosyltransferase family 4 protein [Pyrinomonadaceae bacterium]|nr:glycosyltransferase family 4 protein [Pyrinomonadaceae bacterium]
MKIGIYNLHMQAKGGGEKRTLVLADHLSRGHRVWVFVNEPIVVGLWESYFDVDLSRVNFVVMPGDGGKSSRSRHTKREVLSKPLRHFRAIKSFRLDLFINNSHCSNLPCPAPRGIYMCMFPYLHPISPKTVFRSTYRPFVNRLEKHLMGYRLIDFVNSYAAVTANSQFTAGWIKQVWGVCPDVVYSVCDDMGPPGRKQKVILNVGRFFANGADTLHKRQDVLVSVFKRLRDVQRDTWQLHFAGSVAQDAKTRTLLEQLKNDVAGLPIHFHFDADLDRLRNLYRGASIYWHATGYGSTAHNDPSAQEHFGMTTVEAMSAGAVPIVINSGGQKEIVTQGRNGFLWDELDELSRETTQLVTDANLLDRMSKEAVSASSKFGRAVFIANMDRVIGRVLEQDATT